jgi:hypothetical protein
MRATVADTAMTMTVSDGSMTASFEVRLRDVGIKDAHLPGVEAKMKAGQSNTSRIVTRTGRKGRHPVAVLPSISGCNIPNRDGAAATRVL